jgi:hypothetical protein
MPLWDGDVSVIPYPEPELPAVEVHPVARPAVGESKKERHRFTG